mgnify:FL=1
MTFTERLNQLLKERRLSWRAVSEDLKIGVNQKRYWETHNNLPDGETLKKLSNYLSVSVPYLIGDTNEKAPTLEEPSVEAMYIAELVNDLPAEKRKQVVSYLLELRQKERGSEK